MFPPTLSNHRFPSAQWAVSRLQGLQQEREGHSKPLADGLTFGRDIPPDRFSPGTFAPEKKEKTGTEDTHQHSPAYTVKLAVPVSLLVSAILGGIVGGPLVVAGLLIGIPLANALLGKPHAPLASLVGITGGVVLILRSIARMLSPKKAQTRPASVSLSIPAASSSPATALAPYITPIQTSKSSLPPSNPFSPSKPLPGEKLTIHLPTPQPSHPALTQGMPLHQLTRPVAFILMDPHEGKASLLIYRPATRQFQIMERPANFLLTGNPSVGSPPENAGFVPNRS